MSMKRLTQDTKIKVIQHLKKYWKEPRTCPICQSTSWHVQPGGLIQPITEAEGGGTFLPGEETIPTIQAMCKKCFFVHTFLLMPILGREAADV